MSVSDRSCGRVSTKEAAESRFALQSFAALRSGCYHEMFRMRQKDFRYNRSRS